MFNNLRKIRQNKNIKASEMAAKIGLKTEGAYYKKESGRVPFTLTEGKLVADMLDMSIEDIFLNIDYLVKIIIAKFIKRK